MYPVANIRPESRPKSCFKRSVLGRQPDPFLNVKICECSLALGGRKLTRFPETQLNLNIYDVKAVFPSVLMCQTCLEEIYA